MSIMHAHVCVLLVRVQSSTHPVREEAVSRTCCVRVHTLNQKFSRFGQVEFNQLITYKLTPYGLCLSVPSCALSGALSPWLSAPFCAPWLSASNRPRSCTTARIEAHALLHNGTHRSARALAQRHSRGAGYAPRCPLTCTRHS